jgi:hypothetical protein
MSSIGKGLLFGNCTAPLLVLYSVNLSAKKATAFQKSLSQFFHSAFSLDAKKRDLRDKSERITAHFTEYLSQFFHFAFSLAQKTVIYAINHNKRQPPSQKVFLNFFTSHSP